MSDEEIQRNVLSQLKWDARVKPNEVGVVVKDGVVTLVGTVDSYTKKWTAEETAAKVANVRAVANEIEVQLPTTRRRTDADIARAAKDALEWSAEVPDTVKVIVDQGWITLRGEVEWNFQKEAAERAVRDLAGVKGVINQIEIKPKAPPEDVKKRIEQALIRAAQIDAQSIQVEAQDGRVILKGHVHSWYEKEEAKREAWLAPGVHEVVDELRIEP